MRGKRILVAFLTLAMLCVFALPGWAEATTVDNGDGTETTTHISENGTKYVTTIDQSTYNTLNRTIYYPDGRQETTDYSYPAEGGQKSVTRDGQGNEIGGSVDLPDGSGSYWRLWSDGTKFESIRNTDYKTTQEKFTFTDGSQEITDYSYPAEGGEKSVTHDGQGNVTGESTTLPDGSNSNWGLDPDGTKIENFLDADGRNIQRKFTYPDGRQSITDYSYPAEGGRKSVTRDAQGNVIAESVRLPDRSGSEWLFWPDGTKVESTYGAGGKVIQGKNTFTDGRQEITDYSYPAGGGEKSVTRDAQGNEIRGSVTLPDGSRSYWNLYPDGSKFESSYNADGKYTQQKASYPDGRQEITDYSYPAEGGRESVTRDGQGNVIGESVTLPDGSSSDWNLDSQGIKNENSYDAEGRTIQEKVTYPDGRQETTSYDQDGGYRKTDADGNLLAERKIEAEGGSVTTRFLPNGSVRQRIEDEKGELVSDVTTAPDGRIVAESKLVDGVEHNYYYSPDGTMNEYWSDENEWHAVSSEAWGGEYTLY